MRLLKIKDVATMLSCSVRTAAKLIAPLPFIDLGAGRGKGKRWLESDIEAHIVNRLRKSQPSFKPSSLARLSPQDFCQLIQ